MTTPKATKRKGCSSGILARKPLCNLMLACDGNTLTANRREKGYCGACQAALDRRAKPAPPLKGENARATRVRNALPGVWDQVNPDPYDP